MASLPDVRVAPSEACDWLRPAEIRTAFAMQPKIVRPDLSVLKWTVLCFVLPGTYCLKWLRPKMNLEASDPASQALSFNICVLWGSTAALMAVATALRNPGVVPRIAVSPKDPEQAALQPNGFGKKRTRHVVVNGVKMEQRWCFTCKIYRPLRSKHCKRCDRCVFRYDHHCPWLGNCIGLGNYRSFLTLVVSATLFFGHSGLLTWQVLRRQLRAEKLLEDASADGGFKSVFYGCFLSHAWQIGYITYSSILSLCLFVLALYHAIITGQNMTTNEHVRDYYVATNPFDRRKCADNCMVVLCAPCGQDVEVRHSSDRHSDGATV